MAKDFPSGLAWVASPAVRKTLDDLTRRSKPVSIFLALGLEEAPASSAARSLEEVETIHFLLVAGLLRMSPHHPSASGPAVHAPQVPE
jgi:hypothetical protein